VPARLRRPGGGAALAGRHRAGLEGLRRQHAGHARRPAARRRRGDPGGARAAAGRTQRTVYHERWLGDLWRRPGVTSPAAFIATGWDECAAALDRLAAAPATAGDPCPLTGAGWIAEEALATALYCYLATPDDPVTAIARGAASSGDSDSIACLAGAFAGAALGAAAWPAPWRDRIEYAHHLATIGAAWD
jgi:hypothetical protein